MLAGRSYTDTGDVLVVLSGSEFGDGTMGWNSYLRAYYAGLSFRAGGFKEVVITGGSEGSSSVPVSIAMSQFLTYQGIPAKVIHLETLSHSTRENALYCRAILDALPGRKVLLTSDYHMFRARRTFAKLGMTALPQPVPDVFKRTGRWYGRWPAFLDLLVETCKIGYYWVRGWI
jgi:uncharacterized SAM-binding protein YcdF (DUF218 family)